MTGASPTSEVQAELVAHHELLAGWLGSECEPGVLDDFHAAHTSDFELVGSDGAVVTAGELFDGLSRAGNARPGLRIDIRDVRIVADTAGFVLVRFTENHREGEQRTSRVVTALLRRDPGARNGLRWRHVHETARR